METPHRGIGIPNHGLILAVIMIYHKRNSSAKFGARRRALPPPKTPHFIRYVCYPEEQGIVILMGNDFSEAAVNLLLQIFDLDNTIRFMETLAIPIPENLLEAANMDRNAMIKIIRYD
jgi:hypothetical protein